jgi:octaprenyl-diphosphate synthase
MIREGRALMDSTGGERVSVPDGLRALYAPAAQELESVERILQQELSSQNSFVDRLGQHGFRLGGKRLRPALVLLSAQACGRIQPEHLTLAAAAELIHTATLVHDDVLDEAAIRRHLDTVNARWNNEVSVLLGDYLFARALCLTSSLDDNFACRAIAETTRRMCEGELRQIENRGNYALSEADYFEIIAGKTATLIACCCRLGAHYAGAPPETCETLARYGHGLGVAFQIADDVLDLLGEEATVGKSLGTDLLKQKATLPLIRLFETVDPQQRQQIRSLLAQSGNHHRDALRPWFERFEAIGYARGQAESFSRRAGAELAALPDTPACHSLAGLADFVVDRRQ